MEHKIDEELRQYKLFKIQETEAKLRRYKAVYLEIKQNIVLKFSKNASSNMARLVVGLLTVCCILLGFLCLFPHQIIEAWESNVDLLSELDKNIVNATLKWSKFLFLD